MSMNNVRPSPTTYHLIHRLLGAFQPERHGRSQRNPWRDKNLLLKHPDAIAHPEATSGRKRTPDSLAPTIDTLYEYQHLEAL
jgi:hypothetical protein